MLQTGNNAQGRNARNKINTLHPKMEHKQLEMQRQKKMPANKSNWQEGKAVNRRTQPQENKIIRVGQTITVEAKRTKKISLNRD